MKTLMSGKESKDAEWNLKTRRGSATDASERLSTVKREPDLSYLHQHWGRLGQEEAGTTHLQPCMTRVPAPANMTATKINLGRASSENATQKPTRRALGKIETGKTTWGNPPPASPVTRTLETPADQIRWKRSIEPNPLHQYTPDFLTGTHMSSCELI